MIKKRLNNKGYMLVEIILAFSLAMVVAYFLTDMTIKLKNKNDDLLVKTLVATDQAIIYNTIMEEVYNGTFKCDYLDVDSSGRVFVYTHGKTNEAEQTRLVLNKYIDYLYYNRCSDNGLYDVEIKMAVSQLPDEDFNIDFCYNDYC